MYKIMLAVLVLVSTHPAVAWAQESGRTAGGAAYELMARWDTAKLDRILTDEFPKFSGVGVKYTPARNQHGTVYGKDEVPSVADKSMETAAMIAQFAGQGYAVIGADYFGMGSSSEPEGYMVKAAHQQATVDMLQAGREVLAELKREPSKLFPAGWSQCGFVTMAMLEKLEQEGTFATAMPQWKAWFDSLN